MALLVPLILLYASILLVNTGVAVALWSRHRTALYRALALFWGTYTASLVVQGFSEANDLTLSLGFSIFYVSTLLLGQLFAVSLGVTFPWRPYTAAHLFAMLLSIAAFSAGAPFWVTAMPICVGICGPLIHVLVAYRSRWSSLSAAGRGLMLSCVPYSAHTLDFAFLRKEEWFAPMGFTIAIGVLFAQTMLAFAVAQEEAEAAAREALADKARALAEANHHLRERHEALTSALQRNEQLAEEAQSAAARADASNRAKSTFLANMSHELRTPLNAVIGYAELIEEEALIRPEGIADLARIGRSARSLLGLLDEILDLARVESGRMELHLEEVDVVALVEEVVEVLRPAADRHGDTVEISVDTDLCWVFDRERVRQVLLNLVGNAVKFTQQGRVRIEVAEGEGTLRFRVRDTGMGIAEDRLSSLFQPFTQAHRAIAHTHGGTGLGLALSDRLVRLMGGRIEVDSALGRGSTFTVTLPARTALRVAS